RYLAMSDSFSDLWNSAAPTTPAPRKLGSPSPRPTANRRPQNDLFSMFSSTSSPSSSRPITPGNIQQSTSQPRSTAGSSIGGDAFSGLLGGSLSANSTESSNLTMAERAKQAELAKQRTVISQAPASSSSSAWAGLDSLVSTSSSSASPAPRISTSLLDDDWGFNSPLIPAATSPPKQTVPSSVLIVNDDDDDWGLGLGSATVKITTHPAKNASEDNGRSAGTRFQSSLGDTPSPASSSQGALWDKLEDFESSTTRDASFSEDDLGSGQDEGRRDDGDLLGDLGKPVSHVTSERAMPSRDTPSPAAPGRPQGRTMRANSPPPHVLGRLIEMGFTISQSRAALARVYEDGSWNVEAAIDDLLATTGGAEGSSRRDHPIQQHVAPPPVRRRTSERPSERNSPQPPAANDFLARTTELGFSLFKNAERAFQQGKERVQKAYEEHLSTESDRQNEPSGRPKWMHSDVDDSESPAERSQRKQTFRDDDDAWGEGPSKPTTLSSSSPIPQATGLLIADDSPPIKKPYVSRFRHATGRNPEPQSTSGPRGVPGPLPITVIPERLGVAVSPDAMQRSKGHAASAQEKAALGQYGAAQSAYTLAVEALPVGHLLLVPLLVGRAAARLKEGDFRGVEVDVVTLENIASEGGRSFGAERVTVEGQSIDIGSAVLEAWKRRAEALEGREKWEDAGKDWERVAGAPWAQKGDRDEAVRGAGRCRKMLAPPPPKPKPAMPAVTKTAVSSSPSEAVTKFREGVAAQEEEDLEKHHLKDTVDAKLIAWKGGKETNIRALLASLDNVLWPELGLQASGMKDLVTPGQVKVRYMKAISKLHPDKLNLNKTTLEQRMIANGVFGALNEAWNASK
ncbi:unnamed protein product, partial [Mycena citricolor]